MIRTLALLCLVAAPAFGAYTPNLRVRFDVNPFGFGSSSFIPMPLTISEAVKKGWGQKTGPSDPTGFESLVLYGPSNDNTINLYYDDNENVAGLLLGLDQEQISDAIYDYQVQGFKSWNYKFPNGTSRDYWTTRMYFFTADYLATDAAVRKSNRNAETLIQSGKMTVSGFNGQMFEISTDPTVLADTTVSGFTEQACMVFMGHHFYYNMTKTTECTQDTIFPWFPLTYEGVLIGIGFMNIAKYNVRPDNTNYFENPSRQAVETIVPNGPQCLYELADNPTLITMHTYFIETPRQALCVFEG